MISGLRLICSQYLSSDQEFHTIKSRLKQVTSLFPQDMTQNLFSLHWNTIHKLLGVV